MSCINHGGFETGDTQEADAATGTLAVQGIVKRTGDYALQVNPTTTGTGGLTMRAFGADGLTTNAVAADLYTVFAFRYATKPGSNDEILYRSISGSSTRKLELRLNSSGNLTVYNNVATLLATSTTALSADTWYILRVHSGTGASAAWLVEIWTDGGAAALESLSGTAAIGASNNSGAIFGKIANTNGQTVDFFYDDIHLDDAAFASPAGCVKRLVPTANGSTMQWTAGTGSSNFAEVDDVPANSASYVQSTGGAGEVALFAMQDTATVGITGTVNSVRGVYRGTQVTAATTATSLRVRSGGVNSDTTGIDLPIGNRTTQKVLNTDPGTSVAWTLSGVDGMEVGAVEANAVGARCSDVYAMVHFTPPSGRLLSRLMQDGLYVGAQL